MSVKFTSQLQHLYSPFPNGSDVSLYVRNIQHMNIPQPQFYANMFLAFPGCVFVTESAREERGSFDHLYFTRYRSISFVFTCERG